jgi:DNA polymerase III subunit delta'
MQPNFDRSDNAVGGYDMGFGGLVIPEQVKQGLVRAVKAQRLPTAYLFVGPAGVGKQTTALTLAKALNCAVQDGDACGRCGVCIRIDRRLHPDIHLVEPQGQVIRIDQVRQLREVLTLQAYEGRVKVAILDDAGKLTVEAGNALLKMLEEPPVQTLFLLVCQHLGSLPATVISRAQVMRFGLQTRDQVVALLQQHGRESDAAEHIACLSDGRPGAALAFDLPAGLERRTDALQMLTVAQSSDPAGVLACAERWAKRKGDYDTLFHMLLSLSRDLAVSRAGGDSTILMHGDFRDALAPLGARVPRTTLWEVFDIVHSAQEAIAHNANPQLAFEVMLFKIGDV